MSRTIVVFHLPTDELVYLELGDIVAKPAVGTDYVLQGTRYKVSDVMESIGEFKADGTRRSGMDKLLEMLGVRFGATAVTLLQKLRNIGSGDQPQVGPGGIILPNKSLFGEFDHAVLAVLSDTGKKVSGGVLQQLHTFAAGSGAEAEIPAGGAPHGVEPIRVTDDAATNEA